MKSKIKNILGISLAVLFLLSVTATAVSAYTDPGAGYTPISKPYANFYALPTSVHVSLPVLFFDTSTGGKAVWKYWYFGDGSEAITTGSVNLVSHIYWSRGTYTVTLIEINGAGYTSHRDYIYAY